MLSNGVASLDNEQSLAALKAKYPQRGRPMQADVTKGRAVESMMGLRNNWLELKGGVAPGTGQLRPEFLTTLAECWEEGSQAWELVNSFAMRHVNGDLPPWYFKACMTVETVGLYKTADQDPAQVRPVGMRNPWIKSYHKEVVAENKQEFVTFLEPQQLGMSVAGGAKLVHSVRMKLEQNPSFICVKCDLANAFNDMSRARMVEGLEEEDSLKHLASHAATLYAPASGLESRGSLWGESEEGGTQGDPESGPYFCVGMHKYVKKADQKLAEHDGMARFGWDDGYLVGEAAEVFQALDTFAQDVLVNCGLRLQLTKTEVYCSGKDVPPETPLGLVRAG